MGVNSLRKTVTRQRRACDLNHSPSAPESGTLTTRLPSHLWTYFLHLSMSSVILIDSSTGSPIRYDTKCYMNVRSKADTSQLNLPLGTDN